MLRVQIILLGALATGILLVSRTFGSATVYTDRASFETAIGPHVTYTFDTVDGFPAAYTPIDSLGPIQVNTESLTGGSAYIRNYPVGTTNQTLSGAISAGTSPLYLSFTTPEYAVGFDAFPNLVPMGVTVQFGGNNPSTATFSLDPNDDLAADNSLFFGLTSPDEITSIEVYSVGDVKSRVYGGIDNLTIVPEPLGAGLLPLLVVWFYKKRSRCNGNKHQSPVMVKNI